jgi:hypothetical protein
MVLANHPGSRRDNSSMLINRCTAHLSNLVTLYLYGFARVARMLFAPILHAPDIGWPSPDAFVIGLCEPFSLARRLTCLSAAPTGTIILLKGGFRIRREPLAAAGTNFTRMLFLHPAFLTTAFRHSPWISAAHDPDYHKPRTTPVQPKIFPADFRIVRAAGVFNFRSVPTGRLPVSFHVWQRVPSTGDKTKIAAVLI